MGKDLNHRTSSTSTEVLEELVEVLHDHDQSVIFAAEHGCMEPDEDGDPPCVDVPLGLLRRARSALTRSRASEERVRILEGALSDIAATGESCPDDDEQMEDLLREHLPALARRALRTPAQDPPEGVDEATVRRVEELEWALREIMRHADESFQYSHELCHRVQVDIPQLAEDAIQGFEEEEMPLCYELPEDGVPF